MNPLAKVKNTDRDVIMLDYDERTKQEIVVTASELRSITEIARVATEEITETFVNGEYQVAQALVAKKAIENYLEEAGVSPQEYQLFLSMQTQEYFRSVTGILHHGAKKITEVAARSCR